MQRVRKLGRLLLLVVVAAGARFAFGADAIQFSDETLGNGLRVIYAPLKTAPVVHVRVLYHVGSKDERPERQGFAHMFEHMMFRGSAHVAPEEHMKRVMAVGGVSNAYTSFDETVYWQSLPSSYLDMALWLEADRMASFKVSGDIYKTERNVVAEEWRMRNVNQPYGTMWDDFMAAAFKKHNYRWTPIGNMEHLRAAPVNELQEFFNRYYVPNNAILVVAGNIDVEGTKTLVRKYFGWIPKGAEVKRTSPAEPEQTRERRVEEAQRVPLTRVVIGFHTPQYKADDHYALDILSVILSGGRSGRLDRMLVNGEKPKCVSVGAGEETLEDAGVFMLTATVMQGKSESEVEKDLRAAVAEVAEKGVTAEELRKAQTQERIATIRGRETAMQIAQQLGDEALKAGDPGRVNTALVKLEAVTAEDVKRVADQYMKQGEATTLIIRPDPNTKLAKAAATQAAAAKDAPVVAATKPIEPRVVNFPPDYPTKPPVSGEAMKATLQKGTEVNVSGVKVVVMTDTRLPLVQWSLTMRRGSQSDPKGKEGTAWLTDELVRHGAGELNYQQLNEDLESRAINLTVGDGGDYTRLHGSCTTEELAHGMARTRDILLRPKMEQGEFDKLKEQSVNRLREQQEQPSSVAGEELTKTLWGPESVLGRVATPESVGGVTLEDVKQFYKTIYRPNEAILMFRGT